jgi:arylsulfatase A-like enzyme
MTGNYPQRFGIPNCRNPRRPSSSSIAKTCIQAAETMIGEALQKADYRTGYGGKWHVG